MCSAARVSSLMGRMTGRAKSRASSAANAVPASTRSASTIRRRPSTASTLSSERPELHRAKAVDRHGDDAQVHAVGRAVGEERDAGAASPGRRPVAAGHPDGQPALAIARDAIGPHDLRELGRPARAPRWRRRRAAAQGADALHELALRTQPAVDLRAQLAAHGQVADERGQRDRQAHGHGGHEHEAPAQGHGCSRST